MTIDWSRYPKEHWHCYVTFVGSKAYNTDGVLNDLTLEELRRHIVEPWLEGRPFNVGGTIVRSASEVSRIRVVQTAQVQRYYADEREARRGIDRTVDLRMTPFWTESSTDHTNEFLFSEGPPVTAPPPEEAEAPAAKTFIVHGHDEAILTEVALLLERLDIESVILKEQPNLGRTLIEKLEQNDDVGYAIILFTPDDEGRAKSDKELKPRARQNAVLELGYFYGRLGRGRVCALKSEGVDMPSDLDGVGYVPIDPGGSWQMKLAREMRAAGLPINLNKLA